MSEINAGLPGGANFIVDSLRKMNGGIASLTGASGPMVRQGALLLENAIKRKLSTPGRGRIRRNRLTHHSVQRGKKGSKYSVQYTSFSRASAPGDPPAPDEGTLRSSITHGVVGAAMRVGTNLKKAIPLEFGTKNAGRNHKVTIAPRPYMRPAYDEVKDQMAGIAAVELRTSAPGLVGH